MKYRYVFRTSSSFLAESHKIDSFVWSYLSPDWPLGQGECNNERIANAIAEKAVKKSQDSQMF